MRAYYKNKNGDRICMVCDFVNKPRATYCGRCKISFRTNVDYEKLIRQSNVLMAESALEDVIFSDESDAEPQDA